MSSNIALTGLAKDLAARAATGRPVRIGLIGSGEMGTDIVTRAAMMDGVDVAAISEINVPNAHKAVSISYKEDGHSQDAKSTDDLNAIIESGKTAITDNADLILESGLIDVVIDATGVYGQHRFLGRGGLPAVGEQAMAHAIHYRLPQIINSAVSPFAGRHTLVVGAGYSAATSICALADLAESVADTRITWVVRNPRGKNGPLQHIPEDPLAHRAALTAAANRWADCGERVHYLPGKNIDAVCRKDETSAFEVVLGGRHAGEDVMRIACDFILGHTGFRPDCTLFEELQVQLCYVTEGPIRLAAHLLQEQGGDCLNQTLPTEGLLTTSEPDFFILGNKSYGRDPNFLLSLGLEQIRQLYCQISGDPALNLYESMQRNATSLDIP